MKELQETQPETSLWVWALTAGSLGMFVDNFFGNVSLHFAIPAFLFWWQVGLLFGFRRSNPNGPDVKQTEWFVIPLKKNPLSQSLITGFVLFLVTTCIWSFKKEFQEIYYFKGFKVSKSPALVDTSRSALETAWRWYSREVNTNYELANTYARLSQQSAQMGLTSQTEIWRKKAIWAYLESLRSNCGYDEIYFNLATTQAQIGWIEDEYPGVSIPLPNGRTVLETAEPIGGAITNFSRSLRINPLLRDAYLFLGNLYLRNVQKYRDPGILLFQHALRYYPEDREFWLNLGYLQVQSQQLEQAYLSLKNALILDPFYELTRRNIRALLLQLKREKDPLLEADQILNQTNQWIQTKSWKELRSAYERLFHLLPPHFQFHLILANAYYELKEWEKAEKEYQKALKIDSRNLTALNNLALTYRQTGKIAEAKKIYEEMLILNPNDTNIRAQLQIL